MNEEYTQDNSKRKRNKRTKSKRDPRVYASKFGISNNNDLVIRINCTHMLLNPSLSPRSAALYCTHFWEGKQQLKKANTVVLVVRHGNFWMSSAVNWWLCSQMCVHLFSGVLFFVYILLYIYSFYYQYCQFIQTRLCLLCLPVSLSISLPLHLSSSSHTHTRSKRKQLYHDWYYRIHLTFLISIPVNKLQTRIRGEKHKTHTTHTHAHQRCIWHRRLIEIDRTHKFIMILLYCSWTMEKIVKRRLNCSW